MSPPRPAARRRGPADRDTQAGPGNAAAPSPSQPESPESGPQRHHDHDRDLAQARAVPVADSEGGISANSKWEKIHITYKVCTEFSHQYKVCPSLSQWSQIACQLIHLNYSTPSP